MNTLGPEEIRKLLPQDAPFIMIDRVVDYEVDKSLQAIKNVTENEWSASGSVIAGNVFSEVFIIEAASQAALLLYHLSKIKNAEKRPKYILGKVQAEFFNSAVVGDQLLFEAHGNKMLSHGGYSDIFVTRNKEKIAEITITYSVER